MSSVNQLHFVLFPFSAQGHTIPMTHIARLLALQGVKITIVTTTLNAKRVAPMIAKPIESGHQINLIELSYPYEEANLPEGCDNLDTLPTLAMADTFLAGFNFLQDPVENLLQELNPRPNCIISDVCFPYTAHVARKFGIPRITFNGFSCFANFCSYNIHVHGIFDRLSSDTERFIVPGLPGDEQIEVTKKQLPECTHVDLSQYYKQASEAEMWTCGTIVNSFLELEPNYVEGYKKARGSYQVWCVGPTSICYKDNMDTNSKLGETEWFNWLESQEPSSVLYVCLGSICNLIPSQLIQLGLGLEESKRPFIWVIRGGDHSREVENWILENGYEERIKGRAFLIRGWAPQVTILSHKAIGGFLTHCGWNSTLEGITFRVPMITWPLFTDQFLNEKFIVQVLKIGVSVGAEVSLTWGEEEKIGVLVSKEDVIKAIERFFGNGEEFEERRQRAKVLSKLADGVVDEGGSSYLEMTRLIQYVVQQNSA